MVQGSGGGGLVSYRVSVDPDLCISTGNCVRSAPEAFSFGDDDLSQAQSAAADLSTERLMEIVRGCPVGAVRFLEVDELT